MKAIFQDKYESTDDVLKLKEIDKPVVKDDEVPVLVHAAAVNIRHLILTRGIPYIKHPAIGLRKPKNSLPREDITGKVKTVGNKVNQLELDEEAFGWCEGAIAEYACAGEENIAPKPAYLTVDHAPVVMASAFTAYEAFRDQGQAWPR